MRIRSVTCFVDVDETLAGEELTAAGALAAASRESALSFDLEITTTRLALQPLDEITQGDPAAALPFALTLDRKLAALGFDYAAIMVEEKRRDGWESWKGRLPELLRQTDKLFASLRIASREQGIDFDAVQAAAQVIYELAHTTPGGFGNFRFAGAANCPPGVPFFPAAYHDGSGPAFAFATESADLAVKAFADARDLDEARSRLVSSIESKAALLEKLGDQLASRFGLRFAGIDFSLAPYPEEGRSVGTALERLTGARWGERGTLFAAAFTTDCLRRARFRRAGFSGLMMPVLEDWTLAARSQEDLYSIDSLLLYSTVCGTGLDTVPLAGDTTEAAIAALLLDLAALAVRLDKPLTARLIPVPGVGAGDMTRFSFEYFANARAFGLRAGGALKVFDRTERVQLA